MPSRQAAPTLVGDRFWAVMEAIGVARRLSAETLRARGGAHGLDRARSRHRRRAGLSLRAVPSGAEPPGLYRRGMGARRRALASQALFAAKLLSGEMPENIEDLFAEIHLPLSPLRRASSRWPAAARRGRALQARRGALLRAGRAARRGSVLLFRWRGKSRELLRRGRSGAAARPKLGPADGAGPGSEPRGARWTTSGSWAGGAAPPSPS
jgi:hypothetical protein